MPGPSRRARVRALPRFGTRGAGAL
jgi:hypothetical protein